VEKINQITEQIIGAAMRVHTALGPGLLESAYEACLAYELAKAGLSVERQKKLPITYGKLRLEEGCRINLLVEGWWWLSSRPSLALRTFMRPSFCLICVSRVVLSDCS